MGRSSQSGLGTFAPGQTQAIVFTGRTRRFGNRSGDVIRHVADSNTSIALKALALRIAGPQLEAWNVRVSRRLHGLRRRQATARRVRFNLLRNADNPDKAICSVATVGPYVDSVGTDGLYEIAEEYTT